MRWFGRSDDDRQEEIREHLAMETQANIERGMSPEEAARAARITFGSVAGTRQRLNEGAAGYGMSTLAADVRYALRTIRRSFGLSCAVVLTLSLGIGLTAAVFSLVNSLAFNAPVDHDPASFVRIVNTGSSTRQAATVPRYEQLRREMRSLRELAAWSVVPLTEPLGSENGTDVVGLLASCNFFSVFSGDSPRLGRFLQPEDCASAVPVTVISERLWQDRFAGDSGILGDSISYGGRSLTVVGVAPAVRMTEDSPADLWLPYTIQPSLQNAIPLMERENWLTSTNFYWLQLAGRLQPGTSIETADAEIRLLTSRENRTGWDAEFNLKVTDGSAWSMYPDDVLWVFAAALAFPSLILSIVCATVSTLLLARAVGRRKEMAIRLALGGGRLRLVRMLLVESLVLSVVAAAGSLFVVYRVPVVLLDFVFNGNAPLAVIPDWRVFSYMAVVTLLAAVFSGLTPALESLNLQLVESLKGRLSLGGNRGRTRLRSLLVGVQIAFSMVLVVASVALLRTEQRLGDPGFETRQVISVEIPRTLQEAETQVSLAEKIQSLPGVRVVAYADTLPLVFEGGVSLDLPGVGDQPYLSAEVSADFFSALGIPILSGRTFESVDATSAAGESPAVVSRRFADRFFPGRNPLGETLQVARQERRLRIVGVAENRAAGLGVYQVRDDGSFIYQMMPQALTGYLLVRFDGSEEQFRPLLQSVLRESAGMIVPAATLESRVDERLAMLARIRTLLLILGAVGLSLALVGVFGIVSFTATQQRRDFAVRVALGARPASIFRRVLAEGMVPIPIAMLPGAALSFAVLRVSESMRAFPMGLASQDPAPYASAGLLLLLAVFAALLPPAYRAGASDPVRALREE